MTKALRLFLTVTMFLCVIWVRPNAQAANWYVDNAASGSPNGTSWANAWPSLAAIEWASVKAGDTVYISGGTGSKTYNERLVIGASGTEGNIITIQAGQESEHNGVVILDGTSAGNYSGLSITGRSHVRISGQIAAGRGCNIRIQNFYYSGISISGTSSDLEIAYIETTQNNRNSGASNGLRISEAPELATGLLADIHHCKFHDNNYNDEIYLGQTYRGTRTTYDQIRFHHNEVYDAHADFIKVSAEGTSIYDNIIHSRGIYMSDHPDGIQAWSGYLKIYNNIFHGFHRTDDNNVNAYIRYNPGTAAGWNPNPAYVWIYNNLFYETLPLRFAAGVNYRRGIELSPQSGTSLNHLYFMNNTIIGTNFFGLFLGFKSTHTTANVSDIIIANNLFQDCSMRGTDYGANSIFSIGNGGDGSITYGKWGDTVDVIFDYNTVYASSSVWSTNSQWASTVYSWTDFIAHSGTNSHPSDSAQNPMLDEHYKLSNQSPYQSAGVNLSAYFTSDLSDNLRTNWSIGAYEYISDTDIFPPSAPAELKVH